MSTALWLLAAVASALAGALVARSAMGDPDPEAPPPGEVLAIVVSLFTAALAFAVAPWRT